MLVLMIKYYLTNVTTNLNQFAVIAYFFHDIRCLSNPDTSYVFQVSENIEGTDLFLIKYFLVKFATILPSR